VVGLQGKQARHGKQFSVLVLKESEHAVFDANTGGCAKGYNNCAKRLDSTLTGQRGKVVVSESDLDAGVV
jgi:hypothetical protein